MLNYCQLDLKKQTSAKYQLKYTTIFCIENEMENVFAHCRPFCLGYTVSHWGRDKIADIFQTTFTNVFSWMKMYEFRLKFHWSLFLRLQLTIVQYWFRQWHGADQATSHYLNQWWSSLLTHIRVTRPQWGIQNIHILISFLLEVIRSWLLWYLEVLAESNE